MKKKKMSNTSKQYKKKKNLFNILHLLCLFGPLFYYLPYAIHTVTKSNNVINTTTLGLCACTCIILFIINLLSEAKHRAGLHKSIFWVMLTGVVICLEQMGQVKSFIYVMCITSVLDEIIFSKLKDYYKEKYMINREIDKAL